MICHALYSELEAIASEELAEVLATWRRIPTRSTKAAWYWLPPQARQLLDYLEAELQPNGMLSVEKAQDAGQPLGRERQQARSLVKRLRRRLKGIDWVPCKVCEGDTEPGTDICATCDRAIRASE